MINSVQFFDVSFFILSVYFFVDTVNFFLNMYLYHGKGAFGSIFTEKNDLTENFIILKKITKIPILYLFIGRILVLILSFSFKYFLFLLFFIQLILFYRNYLYMDASEKFLLLILFGYAMYGISITEYLRQLSIFFISFSVFIVYFSTAYHKIKSSYWRKGKIFESIFSSESLYNPTVVKFFQEKKLLSKFLAWGIIFFQMFFFTCIFDSKVLFLILGTGIIFHFINAYFLKLYSFFIIFTSTYPLIYFTSLKVQSFLLSI